MSPQPLPVPTGLYWFMPRNEWGYHELRDLGDHVIGTLRFQPRRGLTWGFTDRERARGEVGSSGWDLSIERKGVSGFFGASATALIDGGRAGSIKAGAFFASGALSLASGRLIRWKSSIFEGTRCRFLDEDGRLLVQINPGEYFTHVHGSIEVQPEAADMAEWPLLVVLALYLRLLMNRAWD